MAAKLNVGGEDVATGQGPGDPLYAPYLPFEGQIINQMVTGQPILRISSDPAAPKVPSIHDQEAERYRWLQEQERIRAERERALQQRISTPSQWGSFNAERMYGASNLNLPGMQLGNQNQAATEQARVIQALQAQAAGSRNTLGQQQLQQGFGQAAAQQRSLGSSIRGTGGGAGLRAGAMGAADTQRGFAGQSEMLKLQEQQAAQAMLAQLLAQQHAQDVGLAGSMASGSLANQQLNQDMERFYGANALGQYTKDYQTAADFERARLGFDLEARDLEDQRNRQFMQAIAGAAASYQGGSKKRPQTQTQSSTQFNDAVLPYDDSTRPA